MNKLTTLTLAILLFSYKIYGQTVVDVLETTLKVGGLGGEEVLYYGFSAGDQLVLNFEELTGKELKEIEIVELPSSSKFMDFKSKKIENKILNINRTGIYKFRLANSALSGRICKVKIQRIPASEETKNFNTSVYWRTVQDTTYTPGQEKFLVRSDTSAQEIYSSNPQISSVNALNGNKNSQIVDFVLPENTISWSFYIGTGNEGKVEYENTKANFVKSIGATASKISGFNPLVALALTGVSYFNKVQGEDNVKYWFLSDANSVMLFNAGQSFMQYKKGDVVSEASQMKSPLNGKIYLAMLNDNSIDPIVVSIKVVVIKVLQEWGLRTIQTMQVHNRQVAYLKN